MDVTEITVSRAEAREKYLEYRKHRQFETPVDAEIKRVYRAISQGSVVIKALESIVTAGVDEKGRPRLAIARADAKKCRCNRWIRGTNIPASVTFTGGLHSRAANNEFTVQMSLPPEVLAMRWMPSIEAIVPIIPLPLRPTTPLDGFHILWEADWREVPKDPLLLKHLGKGDLWLVCAAWDLSEIERTALAGRVRTN